VDEALEVGVDGEAGHPERVAEDDVRGLAADARQRHQGVHRVRDDATVQVDEGLPELDQRIRLGPEEAGGLEQFLELGAIGGGVRGGRGVAREELRGDLVDPHVGGLRRQQRGHGQLEGVRVIELAMRIGMGGREFARHAAGAPLQPQGRLRHAANLRAACDNPYGAVMTPSAAILAPLCGKSCLVRLLIMLIACFFGSGRGSPGAIM
jgi:hypothetical protein